MPLVNNKVGDDCTAGSDKALADGKALVDSLLKVSCCRVSIFLHAGIVQAYAVAYLFYSDTCRFLSPCHSFFSPFSFHIKRL